MDGVSAMIIDYLPSIVMLVVGFALVVVEMYIPGFGAPGIIGLLLLVGGIIMAKPTPLQALIMVLVIVALLCIALSICIHSASKGRLSKSKLVLHDVSTQAEAAETNDLQYFVGHTGVTKTTLRPAGIAEFDGVKLNVVSEGDFIPAGKTIEVERVEGNRIVVKETRFA
jgi:membrane-bound ClpP family serine protease